MITRSRGRWSGNGCAGRPLARERRHPRGFGRRHFGGKFVLGRRALQFLQRQLKLIQKPRGALRARAIAITVQLLDLQLQMGDQRLVIGLLSPGGGSLRASDNQGLSALRRRLAGLQHQLMKLMESQNRRFAATFFCCSEHLLPIRRSAVAKYVADFSSRSLQANSSSEPRSAPTPRHPLSPATRSDRGPAAWRTAIIRSRHATKL